MAERKDSREVPQPAPKLEWRVMKRTSSLESLPNSDDVEDAFAQMRATYAIDLEKKAILEQAAVVKVEPPKPKVIKKEVKVKMTRADQQAERARTIVQELTTQGITSDPLAKDIQDLMKFGEKLRVNPDLPSTPDAIRAQNNIAKALGIETARLLVFELISHMR